MRKVVAFPPINGLRPPGTRRKKDTDSKRRLGKRLRMQDLVERKQKRQKPKRRWDA